MAKGKHPSKKDVEDLGFIETGKRGDLTIYAKRLDGVLQMYICENGCFRPIAISEELITLSSETLDKLKKIEQKKKAGLEKANIA